MDQDSKHPSEAEAPTTESVEQYMRLHEHIERLREDKAPSPPPGQLAPEDARAYQTAALFRAAAPGVAIPDPAFVASLRSCIRQELAAASSNPTDGTQPADTAPSSAPQPIRPRHGVSRRSLIGAGLGAAAAGLAAGVGLGRVTAVQPIGQTAPPPEATVAIVPAGTGTWVAVAAASEIPLGSVKRFATNAIVGFVRHTSSGFSALSGVCTHMGCLLEWNGPARTLDCPCHGGRFSENGDSAPSSPVWYRPLAQIETRVENGSVEVYVPPASSSRSGNPAIRGMDGGDY